jgi:hypothetical protein
MASRIRNLIGWSLFAVYGGIALLGHAGLHAVEGTGHVHSHATDVSSDGHSHSHSHAHGCCHHHPHTSAGGHGDSQPAGQDDHDHHGPGHDHDNCLICHHFAAKAALLTTAAPLNLAAGIEQVSSVPLDTFASLDRYVLPIRGPPTGGC